MLGVLVRLVVRVHGEQAVDVGPGLDHDGAVVDVDAGGAHARVRGVLERLNIQARAPGLDLGHKGQDLAPEGTVQFVDLAGEAPCHEDGDHQFSPAR